ncbi:zf-HC2 domain-containing protein [Paenibacillus sp. GCM10023252]|uniref:zf-HC2 domain-containing protein n=1 Tax=Paenibacillus sp. GCM10023252 TaxID=3252649 RepID=UPI00360DE78B
MNCNVAMVWIHDYIDGELPREDRAELNSHIEACPACRARFEQLERTEAFTYAAMAANPLDITGSASAELTQRIMSGLPKPKRRRGFVRAISRHPGITAAAVFVLVMLGSFVSMWEQDSQLTVSGEDLHQVVIEGNTVTVPVGAQVNGNLVIKNGSANVQGEVEGNVTVIDGSLNLASTGYIAGQSRTIDQALDWIWYKVTETVSGLAQ